MVVKMKVCLNCGIQFSGAGWRCPQCGYEPDQQLGYPQFAPELASSAEGYDASYFEKLIGYETGHFWFESRNKLISWAMQKYFGSAGHFLEVGCGTGFVLSGLQDSVPRLALSGSEIFNEGLKFIRQRIPGASVYQMDIMQIPFAAAFDVVGAFDVLEHIPDDAGALRQMRQAAKPGGGILLTVPQHPALWGAFDVAAHHQRRYTRRELTQKVEQAGFEVQLVTSFVFFPLPVMMLTRARNKEISEQYDVFAEFKVQPLLNRLLLLVLSVERFLIRLGISLPLGGSLLLVAVKKQSP
jgi:SAM-dependent methyltransferase